MHNKLSDDIKSPFGAFERIGSAQHLRSIYYPYSENFRLNKSISRSIKPFGAIRQLAIKNTGMTSLPNYFKLSQTPYMKLVRQGLKGASAWANITKNNSYFFNVSKITAAFNRKFRFTTLKPNPINSEKLHDRVITNKGICLLLMYDHWVLMLNNSKVDKELIKSCKNSQQLELSEVAYTFYSEDHHKNIFRKLDYLISADYSHNQIKLIDGYHDQIIRVRKLLDQDFNNSEVLVNVVMSWVEYAIAARFGVVEDNQGYRIGSKIEDFDELIGQTSISLFDENLIAYYAVFSYLDDLWNPKMQKFEDGKDSVGIGRHSVQHGRVDPRRYTEEVMEKLICLVYALVKLPDIEELRNVLIA